MSSSLSVTPVQGLRQKTRSGQTDPYGPKPVVLAVNKADTPTQELEAYEFYNLGIGGTLYDFGVQPT